MTTIETPTNLASGDETPRTRPDPGSKRRGRMLTVAAALFAAAIGFASGALAFRESGAKPDPGIDLDAFAKAWASGNADSIRAFYADDAVIAPLGHIVDTLHDNPQPEFWDVSGPDLEREAAQHAGARLEFVDAVRIGDIVVATSRWTFPAGFSGVPEGTVITSGDILHVRDGVIWRQFTDFQVFVNGAETPI